MSQSPIVLAAHGSRHQKAVASLEHITEHVNEAFPGAEVRIAFTSNRIRGHLRDQGEVVDSVPEALIKLRDEGHTRAAVQSLHLVPGKEFHAILKTANELMLKDDGFDRIEVGFPLLASDDDIEHVADVFLSALPEHGPGEAVLLLGHGTRAEGDYYDGLHKAIHAHDSAVHVETIEHGPGVEPLIERLKSRNVRKAFMLPFLFGAGWHAARDMVGDGEDSWKTALERNGIECEPVLKGAGEYDQFVALWVDHLSDAMKRLNRR